MLNIHTSKVKLAKAVFIYHFILFYIWYCELPLLKFIRPPHRSLILMPHLHACLEVLIYFIYYVLLTNHLTPERRQFPLTCWIPEGDLSLCTSFTHLFVPATRDNLGATTQYITLFLFVITAALRCSTQSSQTTPSTPYAHCFHVVKCY